MEIINILKSETALVLRKIIGESPFAEPVFQKTKKEFTGDFTLVVFPYTKLIGKSPEETAHVIGSDLQKNSKVISGFNVIKGFLNLEISKKYWLSTFTRNPVYLNPPPTGETILVEYSSPNTNKPLHLGHVRNNLLGLSVSNILKAAGHKVLMVNLVNDRGIHICKSMMAWQKYGNGETPQSSRIKGDHLVGKYYVEFDKHYKEEINNLIESGVSKEEAEKKAPSMLGAQDMLRKWEAGDPEIVALWKTMNEWVYQGFEITYKKLGVNFDKTYYESNTYLLGKEIVKKGLDNRVFFKSDDGSVRIDLTADKLDEKVLLRSDGTSVYITQDLGTAVERATEWNANKMVYVVGNEQEYHFKVLKLILQKLNYTWADGIYHLSYGMVELPHGKMKSREGTVVDADDLIDEMVKTAAQITKELGKIDELSELEAEKLFKQIGLGALKYFILKVDPRKKMLFNPEESIDFNGHTGPFIQYTHARIKSILRKVGKGSNDHSDELDKLISDKEKSLLILLEEYFEVIKDAALNYSPAHIANYIYELAKEYNQFYHDHHILREENLLLKDFRLNVTLKTGEVIAHGMSLLGIEVPERM
jgi:arginyl-tRNA synthetase